MDDTAEYTSRKVSLTLNQTELLVLKSMAGHYGDGDQYDETTKSVKRRILRACAKVGIAPHHQQIRRLQS